MNFIEKIANYRLGNISRSQFPDIAMTALNENIESDSILILAGMSDRDNTFELEQYFNKSLEELNISLPDKLISAKILIRYYLNEIILNQNEVFKIMQIIDNEIYKQVDWVSELNISRKEFVGEELGLERMYTWYRELQDFEDGSMLLYYNDLPKEKQKDKFEEHLIVEAKELKEKIDKEITTHNTRYS